VYKENVRLNEALSYHMAEGDKYKQEKARLHEQNEELLAEKELNDALIKEKINQNRKQKITIKEVNLHLLMHG